MHAINEWLKAAVQEVQEYVRLCWAVMKGITSRPFYYRDLIQQLDNIGWGSIDRRSPDGILHRRGALALQSGMTLDQFGARPVVGRLVSASMIKELGPVLTALMLTSRVGSGIAAELGSMVVAEQVNALRALGTDPVRKLVVPRVIAGTLMCPVLTVISDLVGVTGGWAIAVLQLRVASSVYWNSVLEGLLLGRTPGWGSRSSRFSSGSRIVSIGCHARLAARTAARRASAVPRRRPSSPRRWRCSRWTSS